jgi:hypothetical protein
VTEDELKEVEYSARETLDLLREGHYNTTRPSIDVLRDFADVLLYLANRIDQR